MEIEIETKNKTEVSFKEGDIVALKVDSNFKRTKEPHYYLLGLCANGYRLTDIKTGALSRYAKDNSDYFGSASLKFLLNIYDGKIYSGDKAKLIITRNS